jgi:hypothetical protein
MLRPVVWLLVWLMMSEDDLRSIRSMGDEEWQAESTEAKRTPEKR